MPESLLNHIKRMETWCEGVIGVSACHLPSQRTIEHRADKMFMLCSTYKIPIAVCLLQKVADKELSLEAQLEVHAYDLRPGMASTLNQLNYASPVKFSLLNLLQFMLQESCNSATDLILDLIGGTASVQKMLKRANISDLNVNRCVLEILAEYEGVHPIPDKCCTLAQYRQLAEQVSFEQRAKAEAKVLADPRDHGSPRAMTHLLTQIYQHQILEAEQATLLLNIMRRCKTGPKRLLGLLPPHSRVSHKTGTLKSQVSDVGMIYLPDERGEIIISVYVDANKSQVDAEYAIAEISRSIYDYYLFG